MRGPDRVVVVHGLVQWDRVTGRETVVLPTYGYLCSACGAPTEVRATIGEKRVGLAPRCDACGGTDLRRTYQPLAVLGRRSSAAAAGSGCCGAGGCGCGHS